MILTSENREKIKDLAAKNPNEEICGLIVSSSVFSCKNLSVVPSQNFVLSPLDYLRATKTGRIEAIFHSHISINTEASIVDKDSAAKHNLPIVTYNLKLDTFDVFSQNLGISHVGKQFKLGKSDCFTLFRNYYKEELGIGLPEVSPSDYSNDSKLFDSPDFFGFHKVEVKQQHDVLLTKNGRRNHILVYLGYNKVLHQPINAESLIQDYSEDLAANLIGIYRHDSFIPRNPEKLPN